MESSPPTEERRGDRAQRGRRILIAAAVVMWVAAGWAWVGTPGMQGSPISGPGVPAAQAGDGSRPAACDPSYSPCVPAGSAVTCEDLGYPVALLGRSDPYGLDTDGDGMGCENGQPAQRPVVT